MGLPTGVEVHWLAPEWPAFLDDFQQHLPADQDHTHLDSVRDGLDQRGLVFAATPASDFICGTLQLAAGMNLHVFTTGRRTPYGRARPPRHQGRHPNRSGAPLARPDGPQRRPDRRRPKLD